MSHIPVLMNDVIKALEIKPGKKYIDATLGGGGHAREIIKRGGIVLGIDTDKGTAAKGAWKLVHGNFKDIKEIAIQHEFDAIDGILFDLGFSSNQLESQSRGLSYRFPEAPLDMRLDQTKGITAADIINKRSQEDLYEILATFGEEQLARPIAGAIYRARLLKPVATVGDIVGIVEKLIPDKNKRFGVLSRVFQALRIEVNDELENLKNGLDGAKKLLKPGGMLAVISFHSLEDRIVKQFMRQNDWIVITKHPVVPNDTEIFLNERARSAKLRVASKK